MIAFKKIALLFILGTTLSCGSDDVDGEEKKPTVLVDENESDLAGENDEEKEEEQENTEEMLSKEKGELPYFLEGENSIAANLEWSRVEVLSDEFNAPTFDDSKWQNTDATRWIGRPPGIFKKNTVAQSDGTLQLTVYQLDTPEVVNGNTFTHAGTNITSWKRADVGMYFETRMKANKTFMSSTFWLINKHGEFEGCDDRVAELDIQECVGEVTNTAAWAQSFDQAMHSNTHSRNVTCEETPTGSKGGDKKTTKKVWEAYHVYGAWWKSPKEIIFYLDGKEVYTVVPVVDFDLEMYVRLVTETYDWNKAPVDGGMTGSKEERTTYYDWVRTWELKEKTK